AQDGPLRRGHARVGDRLDPGSGVWTGFSPRRIVEEAVDHDGPVDAGRVDDGSGDGEGVDGIFGERWG
ncbi:MAG: hypothetical protein ACPHQP_12300, partial [Longimicrobiales bacterium]